MSSLTQGARFRANPGPACSLHWPAAWCLLALLQRVAYVVANLRSHCRQTAVSC